jgi:hypothetical protein
VRVTRRRATRQKGLRVNIMGEQSERVDVSGYLRLPKVNVSGAVAMAKAMITATPKDAPAGVRHAARTVRSDAVALQSARQAGRKVANNAPKRPQRVVDNVADALHGTIHRRIGDHELLAEQAPETAARAATLKARLYPEGTAFLRGNYFVQWEETEAWVKTLAEDDNDAALRALVGDGFVDALLKVHVEYGAMIGTTRALSEAPAKVDLATPLAALTASMQDLALQLAAVANDGSAAVELRAAARAALRPIDDLRDVNARRAARRAAAENDGEEGDEEVDEDIPNVA